MSKLDDLIFGIRDIYDSSGVLLARKSKMKISGGSAVVVGDTIVVTAGGGGTEYTDTSEDGAPAVLSVPLVAATNYSLDITVVMSRTETSHDFATWKFFNVPVQNVGGVAAILNASPLMDAQVNGTAYTVTLDVDGGANVTITCTGTAGQTVAIKAVVNATALGGF